MSKRQHAVQTPGEATTKTEAPPAADANGTTDPTIATATPPRVSASDKIEPAVLNGTSEAPIARTGGLPDQSEIDPAAIPFGQRVLTKQGWVCSTVEPPQQARR